MEMEPEIKQNKILCNHNIELINLTERLINSILWLHNILFCNHNIELINLTERLDFIDKKLIEITDSLLGSEPSEPCDVKGNEPSGRLQHSDMLIQDMNKKIDYILKSVDKLDRI